MLAVSNSDHGRLLGLSDDDHTQYHTDARANTWLGTKSISDIGTKTHSLLSSLTDDDHTQYALLAGRSGGQTLIGGTESGNNLTLQSTSNSTKGKILLGSSDNYFDDVNKNITLQAKASLATLGDNLIDNGTFDAGSTTGWTLNKWAAYNDSVAGDVLVITSTRTNYARYSFTFTAGKMYKVFFDAIQTDEGSWSGALACFLGGTMATVLTSPQAGVVAYVVAGSSNNYLQFTGQTLCCAAVDNVTVQEVFEIPASNKWYDDDGVLANELRVVECLSKSGIDENPNFFMGKNAGRFTQSLLNGNFGIGFNVMSSPGFAGFANFAMGARAGEQMTTGGFNMLMGYWSGRYLTTGIANVGLGSNSLAGQSSSNPVTGSFNIGIGSGSLSIITSGSNNIAIGQSAGNNITTGQGNTIIGYDRDAPSATGNDQLVIGTETYEYIRGISNCIRIGGGATPTARLHLPAGTATANTAPLKFTSGTSLTTAEVGAMEFTTDDLYFTITTGTARKGIVLDNGTRLTSGKIPVATTNGRLVDLTAQAYEADAKADYTTGDLDTEAEIITALNATNSKINSIITKLENLKLFETS